MQFWHTELFYCWWSKTAWPLSGHTIIENTTLIKYALVLLLFLDVMHSHSHIMLCLDVGNQTHNSNHSTMKSLIPTLSPKVNLRLTLTLALLTLLNPTNPNHSGKWRWWWTLTMCTAWLCMALLETWQLTLRNILITIDAFWCVGFNGLST